MIVSLLSKLYQQVVVVLLKKYGKEHLKLEEVQPVPALNRTKMMMVL